MKVRRRTIKSYETTGPEPRRPFDDWIDELNDIQAVGIIFNRLDRVKRGNLGDHGPVGDGVWELRLDFGPGYRVYYGEDRNIIVLLSGGKKKTQSQDIVGAKEYWRDYNA